MFRIVSICVRFLFKICPEGLSLFYPRSSFRLRLQHGQEYRPPRVLGTEIPPLGRFELDVEHALTSAQIPDPYNTGSAVPWFIIDKLLRETSDRSLVALPVVSLKNLLEHASRVPHIRGALVPTSSPSIFNEMTMDQLGSLDPADYAEGLSHLRRAKADPWSSR